MMLWLLKPFVVRREGKKEKEMRVGGEEKKEEKMEGSEGLGERKREGGWWRRG